MTPTFSNQTMAADEQAMKAEATTGNRSRLGEQLDELAVFAFVAVAVIYIAAATYGLFW
ncbi:MAG TPA: hypothetical protein VEU51_10690 [Candidatus Acidoferrales bacterium]|nr:hypothetical protein [Candidatus Acidoferrales bacterium]